MVNANKATNHISATCPTTAPAAKSRAFSANVIGRKTVAQQLSSSFTAPENLHGLLVPAAPTTNLTSPLLHSLQHPPDHSTHSHQREFAPHSRRLRLSPYTRSSTAAIECAQPQGTCGFLVATSSLTTKRTSSSTMDATNAQTQQPTATTSQEQEQQQRSQQQVDHAQQKPQQPTAPATTPQRRPTVMPRDRFNHQSLGASLNTSVKQVSAHPLPLPRNESFLSLARICTLVTPR